VFHPRRFSSPQNVITPFQVIRHGSIREGRNQGIRKFIKTERQRWTCSNCGGIICVHRGFCFTCGEKKNNPVIFFKGALPCSQQLREPVSTTTLAPLFEFTPVAGCVERAAGEFSFPDCPEFVQGGNYLPTVTGLDGVES